MSFHGSSDSKESACSVGDPGLISESVRSPGEGHGYSLQYSCLENSKIGGSWWATVHGTAKWQTQLGDWYTSKGTEWKQWGQSGRGCVWRQAWLLRDVIWTRFWRLKGASMVMTPTHQWFTVFFLSSFLPNFLPFFLAPVHPYKFC